MRNLIAALLAVIVLLLSLLLYHNMHLDGAPAFRTPYQAIVLTNNQVYYGKLENAAGMYPVLRDIFYVVEGQDPQTKQPRKVLVRRGNELHGPDFMVLNRQSILFIEPVGENSQIAKSIAEQSKNGK